MVALLSVSSFCIYLAVRNVYLRVIIPLCTECLHQEIAEAIRQTTVHITSKNLYRSYCDVQNMHILRSKNVKTVTFHAKACLNIQLDCFNILRRTFVLKSIFFHIPS